MSEIDRQFGILNWIDIIDQLATTKSNRVLDGIGLSMPPFVVLNHFSHCPDEPRTVTGVAAAFQQPQSGMTKTIQKLVEGGYLRAEADAGDKRVKQLRLTPEGIAGIFAGWDERDLEILLRLLDRLRIHLDTRRGSV